MPYQVSRTDTGQYVLQDPASDAVVIDDELAAGFAKLDAIVAARPRPPVAPIVPAAAGSAFEFRGGPRYLPILLAVVLPFAWLVAAYLMLSHLLAGSGLDRAEAADTQAKIDELEAEVQALRSEIAGAPRTAKSKPKRTNRSQKAQAELAKEPAADDAAAEDGEPKPASEQPAPSPGGPS